MSPSPRPRPTWPVLVATLWSLGACGGDDKPRSDTTTPDTDTTADVTPDTTSCEGLAGTRDCPCRDDLGCDGDLTCIEGVCQAVVATGLELPAGARGCEVLLSESSRVSEVRFAAGVRGTFIREAPRVAIAVVQELDADFAPGAVEVLGAGSPLATVVSARCVDAAGAVIPNASVTLR